MTHTPENPFHDRVVDWLGEFYPVVETNEYLPEPYRFADVVVPAVEPQQLYTLAIEVDNDFEAAIKGVGQAAIYAGALDPAIPVVLVPAGHVEEPERTYLFRKTGIPVLETPF